MIRKQNADIKSVENMEEFMPDRVELSGGWLLEIIQSSIKELQSFEDEGLPILTDEELDRVSQILDTDSSVNGTRVAA